LSDFGNKSVFNNQLDILNEKFNKKPEIVPIVKFCLENFSTKEFKDNLKVVTRFENEDYMIDTVDTNIKISFLIFYLNFLFFIYMSLQRL
jgi:hypothetical protein